MGLFAPLALLLLPLLGLVVALYLLKLRRPTAPIGSLHLWDSLVRDREANSLWQRLRVQILLVLQFLALLILIVALARPWVTSTEAVGQNVIIVLDVSATMGATDADRNGSKTRLEAAKDEAKGIVDDLPQGGTVTLLASDKKASIIVPATDDKARVRGAIDALSVQPAGSDMNNALQLAGALAARQKNSLVWVISDGAFPPVAAQVEPLGAPVRFVPIGTGKPNQGITAFSLEPGAGAVSLFVQVANSADVTVTRRIDLIVDDAPWNARTVTIGAGATEEVVIEDLPLGARVIQAEIGQPDSLPVDDRAWVINRASVPARVLLVSGGNTFLEVALSLLPTVTLYKISPADYDPEAKIEGVPPDLTVFDADAPPALLENLPSSNLLLIAPQGSSPLLKVRGVITDPVAAPSGVDNRGEEQSVRDPLLRFVDVSSVHVARAKSLELPSWARTVLDSDQGPLIIAGATDGRKVAVLAFDLHDTDLPVQTAFPLLVRNLVTFLLPDPSGGLPAAVSPGETVGIEAVSPDVDQVLVEDAQGKEWSYGLDAATRRVAFGETRDVGVYYVAQYQGSTLVAQEAFAVNVFARDESLANVRATAEFGPSETGVASSGQQDVFRQDVWPTLALVALLILLAEWLYAHRMAARRAIVELNVRRAQQRADDV